jgi:carbamoyl-phosphate synthase large subunit
MPRSGHTISHVYWGCGSHLVINIPIEYDGQGRPDGYHIRRRAVDAGIPLITDLQRAQSVIEALRHRKVKDLAILSWDEYAARRPVALK